MNQTYHAFHEDQTKRNGFEYKGVLNVSDKTSKDFDTLMFMAIQTYGKNPSGVRIQTSKRIMKPPTEKFGYEFLGHV